jgi:hypothetical protein
VKLDHNEDTDQKFSIDTKVIPLKGLDNPNDKLWWERENIEKVLATNQNLTQNIKKIVLDNGSVENSLKQNLEKNKEGMYKLLTTIVYAIIGEGVDDLNKFLSRNVIRSPTLNAWFTMIYLSRFGKNLDFKDKNLIQNEYQKFHDEDQNTNDKSVTGDGYKWLFRKIRGQNKTLETDTEFYTALETFLRNTINERMQVEVTSPTALNFNQILEENLLKRKVEIGNDILNKLRINRKIRKSSEINNFENFLRKKCKNQDEKNNVEVVIYNYDVLARLRITGSIAGKTGKVEADKIQDKIDTSIRMILSQNTG